jgi:hypothetical protein
MIQVAHLLGSLSVGHGANIATRHRDLHSENGNTIKYFRKGLHQNLEYSSAYLGENFGRHGPNLLEAH